MIVFHITSQNEWRKAQNTGIYEGDTLSEEGFIHCSTISQVIPVANRRFLKIQGLVLLCIETDKVYMPIQFENFEGGDELFPHIYGSVPIPAVVRVIPFPPDLSGQFTLPVEIIKLL
jgi:uncharacterized protein (DUF952 family)